MSMQDNMNKVRDYIIEHGWAKGDLEKADGSVCLRGAMVKTRLESPLLVKLVSWRIRKAFPAYSGTLLTNSTLITSWNDHCDRSLDEVLTILSDKWHTLKEEGNGETV